MKFKKRVNWVMVDVEIEKIKNYGKFSLYQVYKLVGGDRIPLYKRTFTSEQLQDIIDKHYILDEEGLSDIQTN